jgi:thiol-disulfide isomerase/thioredoxin
MSKQVRVTVILLSIFGGVWIQHARAAESNAKRAFALMVGDKAPALSISKWVKGEAVAEFVKGKVYVVEFWATWCPPCIQSIPHLTELQKKYKEKGLTVIGATALDSRGNTLARVEGMVEAKGKDMGYTVAWDKGRETAEAYMRAAGKQGLPSAFVVNQDGRIAFIGHPMEMGAVVDEVVSGKHDLKAAEALYTVRLLVERAKRTRNWADALEGIDSLIGKDESRNSELVLQKFQILLFSTKEYDKAYAVGRVLTSKYLKDDAQMLNRIAWTLLDNKGIKKRDPDLALEAAQRANELTKGAESSILDTLAYAYYHKGDAKKALELQKIAIEKAGASTKKQLQGRLKLYEEKVGEG